MAFNQKTWTKIAVGVAAVIIIFCVLKMSSCNCKKAAVPPKANGIPVTLRSASFDPQETSAPMVMTAVPLRRPEKFAPYEPDEDDEEEEQEFYADYIPAETDSEQREMYVDASDVYSPPEYRSELLN